MNFTPQELPSMDWRAEGACRGYDDPTIFFPDVKPGQNTLLHQLEHRAKAICWGGCPVRGRCLQHALEHEDHGVWGGATEYERIQIRKGILAGPSPHVVRRPAPGRKRVACTTVGQQSLSLTVVAS